MANGRTVSAGTSVKIGLWLVQGLLALTFVVTGIWKVATPIPQLAAMIP